MMMNDELRVVTLEELKLQMHEDFEDEDAIITHMVLQRKMLSLT